MNQVTAKCIRTILNWPGIASRLLFVLDLRVCARDNAICSTRDERLTQCAADPRRRTRANRPNNRLSARKQLPIDLCASLVAAKKQLGGCVTCVASLANSPISSDPRRRATKTNWPNGHLSKATCLMISKSIPRASHHSRCALISSYRRLAI